MTQQPIDNAPVQPRRLIVMDVDSTLIGQEVIELIAAHAGTQELVARITEQAMAGDLDFSQSLEQRVATLKGVPVTSLSQVRPEITFSPGAPEFVAECHRRGWIVALVSGGFTEIVSGLATELGIELFQANRLEVADGKLTGRTTGQIVDRAFKEIALRNYAANLGIDMENTVAIGDGANDLDMIAAAGIGIAFNAKPIVQEQAPYAIFDHLDNALAVIDSHVSAPVVRNP